MNDFTDKENTVKQEYYFFVLEMENAVTLCLSSDACDVMASFLPSLVKLPLLLFFYCIRNLYL